LQQLHRTSGWNGTEFPQITVVGQQAYKEKRKLPKLNQNDTLFKISEAYPEILFKKSK